MRTSALEQLATIGVVLIERKGTVWHVQFIGKDESGFLTGRQSEWGNVLYNVIRELLEEVLLAE